MDRFVTRAADELSPNALDQIADHCERVARAMEHEVARRFDDAELFRKYDVFAQLGRYIREMQNLQSK